MAFYSVPEPARFLAVWILKTKINSFEQTIISNRAITGHTLTTVLHNLPSHNLPLSTYSSTKFDTQCRSSLLGVRGWKLEMTALPTCDVLHRVGRSVCLYSYPKPRRRYHMQPGGEKGQRAKGTLLWLIASVLAKPMNPLITRMTDLTWGHSAPRSLCARIPHLS